ncbi:TauD/TfdA family dioxygenase [Nonomuraea sp. NPDC049714]|uniref:TauD/TfdA family dioxygenase n=1 Tax=Nonomuraea sp. NPDC049714 TaxID=3364357 RepID=UPI00379A142F
MSLVHVQLETSDSDMLRDAAIRLAGSVNRLEDISALDQTAGLISELPDKIRDLTSHLRSTGGQAAAVLLSGIDIGTLAELPTPSAFGQYDLERAVRLTDSTMFMLGATIGIPYCFASQQRGRIVLDVFPLIGRENRQLGCSSTTALEWHNEDAFHPLRADYSLLCCIRNERQVATRYVIARELVLDPAVEAQLRIPEFAIVPDESHTYVYNLATSGVAKSGVAAFARVKAMADDLPRAAVLSGAVDDPWINVDFAYMPAEIHSEDANAALAELRVAIERASRRIELSAGDVLVIDNKRAVHGRDSFVPQYDGSDRWLRRLNVLQELPPRESHFIPGTLQIT